MNLNLIFICDEILFFSPCCLKTILGSQAVQTQAAGWTWPPGGSLLTPGLETTLGFTD